MVVKTTPGPSSWSAEFGRGREVGMRRMEGKQILNWNPRDRRKKKKEEGYSVCVEVRRLTPTLGNVLGLFFSGIVLCTVAHPALCGKNHLMMVLPCVHLNSSACPCEPASMFVLNNPTQHFRMSPSPNQTVEYN